MRKYIELDKGSDSFREALYKAVEEKTNKEGIRWFSGEIRWTPFEGCNVVGGFIVTDDSYKTVRLEKAGDPLLINSTVMASEYLFQKEAVEKKETKYPCLMRVKEGRNAGTLVYFTGEGEGTVVVGKGVHKTGQTSRGWIMDYFEPVENA